MARVIVVARLFRAIVGSGADQVSFMGQDVDLFLVRGIFFDEGCVGSARNCVCEDDAATQRRVPRGIDGGNGLLIHEEDNLAAGFCQRWPAAFFSTDGFSGCQDGFGQSVIAAADLVWRNHLRRLENRADFPIERIEGCRRKGLGAIGSYWRVGASLLGFHQDEDGEMVWVLL